MICNAQQAIALHSYPKPAMSRFFVALARWGWVLVLLAVVLLTGCDDLSVDDAAGKDLQDAQQQAAAEWRQIARQAND